MTAAARHPPGRVLVRAPNWLGDAVLALPTIAAVRRHFPGAHLAIAGPGPVAAVPRMCGEYRQVESDERVLKGNDRANPSRGRRVRSKAAQGFAGLAGVRQRQSDRAARGGSGAFDVDRCDARQRFTLLWLRRLR